MSSRVNFTFGDIGSVRDTQTVSVSRDTPGAAGARAPGPDEVARHRIGAYVASYAPLKPGDLTDLEVDAELEAMLAASTVVHQNEGV